MILNNSKRLSKKSHDKDVEKMSNNNSIESLQDIKVETSSGKVRVCVTLALLWGACCANTSPFRRSFSACSRCSI